MSSALQLSRDLRVGSRGEDVRALQVFLNQDPDTALALSGQGSLGNETEYFGNLTKKAVISFQNKYRQDVLLPIGLYYATGYVGGMTRAKINEIYDFRTEIQSSESHGQRPEIMNSDETKIAVEEPMKNPNIPEGYENHPNFEHYEEFVGAIRTVGSEQGYSLEELDFMQEKVTEALATTTDYQALFLQEQLKNNELPDFSSIYDTNGPSFGSFFSNIGNYLLPTAHAQAPQGRCEQGNQICFGSMVIFPFLCTCSGNWLITMRPFPPRYIALLTHYQGAQAYLSYNTPFTRWLVGFYQQGGQCQFYAGISCVSLPSQGQTSPRLGSSRTP